MTNKSKNLLAIFCALTILFSLCMSAGAINVVVNGKKLTMAQQPIMHNGRVMVPMRNIFEALGVAVFYEPGMISCVTKEKTVSIRSYYDYGITPVSDYSLFVDDVEVEMDRQPINRYGTMLVPIRVISEAWGATVDWDKQSETVTVTANISDEVKLSKAEIDAANDFGWYEAREMVADNKIYRYFDDSHYSLWSAYYSFDKGIKSIYMVASNNRGDNFLLKISINGEVSFDTQVAIGDDGDYAYKHYTDYKDKFSFSDQANVRYQLSTHAEYLPFQEKFDGYLCGMASVHNIDAELKFKERYSPKTPTDFWTTNAFSTVVTQQGKESFFIFPKYEGTNIVIRTILTNDDGEVIHGDVIYDGSGPVLLRANAKWSEADTEVTVTLGDEVTKFYPSYSNLLFYKDVQRNRVFDLTIYEYVVVDGSSYAFVSHKKKNIV